MFQLIQLVKCGVRCYTSNTFTKQWHTLPSIRQNNEKKKSLNNKKKGTMVLIKKFLGRKLEGKNNQKHRLLEKENRYW